MFRKKTEILILLVLMAFSGINAFAAIEANIVTDTNVITEPNASVAEVKTVADIDVHKTVEPVEPQANEFDRNADSAATAYRRDDLLSPLTAKTFYDIGYDLYTDKNADYLSARQSLIFFNAAINLDSRANYVLADIINIAWQNPDENFSQAVKLALNEYIDFSSDLEVASRAVGYLLEKLDSREQRQELLINLLSRFQNKNTMFSSDLLTQLGLLAAETADVNQAQNYLIRAFLANKYNRLAFAKLAELAELSGQPLGDISYLQNLRFAVRANPLDLDSALRFAQYSELLGLFEPASAAYKYCMDLSGYMNNQRFIETSLYRQWILNCYNAGQFGQCRQILQQVRDKGIFDIRVEAIASAAAMKNGDNRNSKAILDDIELRSNKILSGQAKSSVTELIDYAWFYSFIADVNSEEVLTWSTKAYEADPNSLQAASIFAYALVINNQFELADTMLKKIGTAAQPAGLAKAMILVEKQDVNSAAIILHQVINAAPGNFEAQKAKAKLKELGLEYTPPLDSAAMITLLQNDFGQQIFSEFVEPGKMVSVELTLKGSTFSYGSEIIGNLSIINNYSEPMLVCPDGMIKGNIRVDVKIGGDLNLQIPAFIVKTVRPSKEIRPGNALFIPLRFDTGTIKNLLDSHPQAELNIEYTAYIDPVMDANGLIRNPYGIKPVKVVIKRPKLDINTRYLQQRLDALKKGQSGQKVKSAQLFAGLLAEQQIFRRSGTAYRFVYAEPQLLSSALAKCLAENDWILKAQTIAAMLKLKLDYRLTEGVSEELENSYWPVRLMAVFILSKNENEKFKQVLSWTAKNDSHPIVKELAGILSGDITAAVPNLEPVEPNNEN